MPNWSRCADIGSFKKPVFCVNIISKHTVTNEAPPQDIDFAVFRLQKDIAPIPTLGRLPSIFGPPHYVDAFTA